MPQTSELQELTYLSKTNITQTLIYLREAQSYLQEQMAKELFEHPQKGDFLEASVEIYDTNRILILFIEAIKEFENSKETAIGLFKKMQDYLNYGDIYDAIAAAFCFYFLSLDADLEFYTDKEVVNSLQHHYNEVNACSQELILFIKNNKI